MHNARLTERASYLGHVDVVPHASELALRVWAQDISETGMFLQTTQPFRTGEVVSLRFDVDDDEVHIRAAEVVWVRRFEPISVDGKVPGVGLRFLSVDSPARALLRRLTRAANDNRDTIIDDAIGSMQPSAWPTLPPLQKARQIVTHDFVRPTELDQSMISLAPFSQPPLAISLPPDEPMLSSETRVFDGLPPAPRTVTMGPKHTSNQPMPSPDQVVDNNFEPDPFVNWTFRLSVLPEPAEHSEEETASPSFHERFDDDAPPSLNKSVLEDPSILESSTLPPAVTEWPPSLGAERFNLGSLPPGFDDGSLAIRHLPLLQERQPAPSTQALSGRRSLGTAVAFLVAGCCAGGVVGLVHQHHKTTASPTLAAALPPLPVSSTSSASTPPVTTTIAAPVVAPLPSLAPLLPKPIELAEAGLNIAPPPPDSEGVEATPAPTRERKAAAEAKHSAPTLVSTTKAPATEALVARPGHLEVELPAGGKVQRVFTLAGPSRIVIDLQEARLPSQPIDIDEGGVLQLRFGYPQRGTQRVVVVVAGKDKPASPQAHVEGGRLTATWSW